MIERDVPNCEMLFVHAAPDILVGDLLKSSKATKLFTVFGLPDVRTARAKDGKVTAYRVVADRPRDVTVVVNGERKLVKAGSQR